jgi:hypothetical protein
MADWQTRTSGVDALVLLVSFGIEEFALTSTFGAERSCGAAKPRSLVAQPQRQEDRHSAFGCRHSGGKSSYQLSALGFRREKTAIGAWQSAIG